MSSQQIFICLKIEESSTAIHPQLVSNEKYQLQTVSHFIILKQIMWDGMVTKNNNYREKGIYEFNSQMNNSKLTLSYPAVHSRLIKMEIYI